MSEKSGVEAGSGTDFCPGYLSSRTALNYNSNKQCRVRLLHSQCSFWSGWWSVQKIPPDWTVVFGEQSSRVQECFDLCQTWAMFGPHAVCQCRMNASCARCMPNLGQISLLTGHLVPEYISVIEQLNWTKKVIDSFKKIVTLHHLLA